MLLRSIILGLLLTLHAVAEDAGDILPIFQKHCVKCHGQDGKIKGKVNLAEIGSVSDLRSNAKLLGQVIEAIDFDEMPPEDEPQIKEGTRATLLKELKTLLHRSIV